MNVRLEATPSSAADNVSAAGLLAGQHCHPRNRVAVCHEKPFNYLAIAGCAPEIVAILARWGFEDLLLQLDTPPLLLKNLVRSRVAHLSYYERVRSALEDFGADLREVRSDSQHLPRPLAGAPGHGTQEAAQPGGSTGAFQRVEAVLLKELGDSVERFFAVLEKQPFAAGSLGQVYRAPLHGTEECVAVKVQRADIHKTVSADLEIIGWFARQLHARIEELRPYNLPALVREAESGSRKSSITAMRPTMWRSSVR